MGVLCEMLLLLSGVVLDVFGLFSGDFWFFLRYCAKGFGQGWRLLQTDLERVLSKTLSFPVFWCCALDLNDAAS